MPYTLAATVAALIIATAWWRLFRSVEAPAPSLSAPVTLERMGKRTYNTFVPARLSEAPALLLVLHGSHGDAGQMRRYTGHEFERLADEHGFIVVYPEGYGGYWNDARRMGGYAAKRLDIDDVAFVRAIVARYQQERGVARVFAVGYSNGGYMCIRTALEAADIIDAIATFGANVPTDDNCVSPALARPMPAMFVNGTRDPITPYGGGRVTIFGFGNRGTVRSALASAEYFAARLGGDVTVEESENRRQWTSPTGGRVLLYTVHGGGHVIPQPRYRFAGIMGYTEMQFNAPAACWDFFSSSTRVAATSS